MLTSISNILIFGRQGLLQLVCREQPKLDYQVDWTYTKHFRCHCLQSSQIGLCSCRKTSSGLPLILHFGVCACLLSSVRLFATPWTTAYPASLSMGFSMQDYWSGLPFPSPGDLPDPLAGFFTTMPLGELYNYFIIYPNIIITEIKCTINVVCLDQPETIPPLSMEKLSSVKRVAGPQKIVECCTKLYFE